MSQVRLSIIFWSSTIIKFHQVEGILYALVCKNDLRVLQSFWLWYFPRGKRWHTECDILFIEQSSVSEVFGIDRQEWMSVQHEILKENQTAEGTSVGLILIKTHSVTNRVSMSNVHVSKSNNWHDRLVEGREAWPSGTHTYTHTHRAETPPTHHQEDPAHHADHCWHGQTNCREKDRNVARTALTFLNSANSFNHVNKKKTHCHSPGLWSLWSARRRKTSKS